METLVKDIKHAWRMFRDNKLFTATAVAALTLGIGVNIAIFSVVGIRTVRVSASSPAHGKKRVT